MRNTGVLFGPKPSSDKSLKNQKISLTPNNPKPEKEIKTKGALFLPGQRARLYFSRRASFTIEAALVLPFFLLLMMSVLYLFEIALLQMQIRDALYDTALLRARTAYLTQSDAEDASSSLLSSAVSAAASSLSIQDSIDDTLGSLIIGGKAGIVCTENAQESTDAVTALTAQCVVKLPVGVFGSIRFTICESVSVRNWVGYDPTDTETSDMVYVTANGTVYHEDRNCTYLNPSIRAVSAAAISSERNSSGAKYSACAYCGGTASSVYYVTNYGTSYHTSYSCSALKRTVYLVSRDETDLPACSKCGGGT